MLHFELRGAEGSTHFQKAAATARHLPPGRRRDFFNPGKKQEPPPPHLSKQVPLIHIHSFWPLTVSGLI